jgi:glycosyltransferase involved in cell wall biosynthesis
MEANPVSILEALAAEVPVVAPSVGSVGETVLDGKTGRLVPPGDVEAAAAAVIDLLTHPDRADAMGRAGREHVLAHWSIGQMVGGFQELLAGVYRAKADGRPQSMAAPPPDQRKTVTSKP